jgi:hypothetical protein
MLVINHVAALVGRERKRAVVTQNFYKAYYEI